MAVDLVHRHGLAFRSHAGAARAERPGHLLPAAAGFIGGAAALTVAVLYAAGRLPSVPLTTQPAVRLGLAAVIGLVLTAVHTHIRNGRAAGYSLARAQTLLCVAGALTMILIDNSVARAFGIAGAASIVRFRTPVDDPTDATVLFLSMALGMASGVGAFGLAMSGTVGVCLLLLAFGAFAPESRRRNITIELVATGHEFPERHVRAVFARHGVPVEVCEWSQDAATRVTYRASVHESLPLESLGDELMSRGEAGLQSVTWEVRKNAA